MLKVPPLASQQYEWHSFGSWRVHSSVSFWMTSPRSRLQQVYERGLRKQKGSHQYMNKSTLNYIHS